LKFFNFGKNSSQVEIEKQKTLQKYISLKRDALDQLKTSLKDLGKDIESPPKSLSPDLYPDAKNIYGQKINGFWNCDHDRLQRISQIAYWEMPTARSIIDRFCDIVIGASLDLQSVPIWDLIKDPAYKDTEKRKAKTKEIEARWKNWANHKDIDYEKIEDHAQMTYSTFWYRLLYGEFFKLYRYAPTLNKNPLTIQIIPPENIKGGVLPENSKNTLENGIEYDRRGRAVAYHIYNDNTGNSIRVTKKGAKSGRVFVVHDYISHNRKIKRGVGILVKSIPQLAKLSDFESLELKAAIINALFAVFIKPPSDSDGRPVVGGKIPSKKIFKDKSKPTTADLDLELELMDVSEGGIFLDELPAGHEPQSFDTKRPNVNFETFFNTVQRNICSSLNIPVSVVNYMFKNNYSSTRGELMVFWYTVIRLMKNHGKNSCQPDYVAFLEGEVANGKLDLPGWKDEEQKRAWSNANWNGNQRPDIDPLRSVKAAQEEQKFAYKTGQQIASERGGGDYDENLEVVTNEFAGLTEAVRPYVELNKRGGQN
jgi:lambda family phage portal protein